MPSYAYRNFSYNIGYVDALIDAHSKLNALKGGKPSLSHITNSAVINICTCWETYIEDLTKESSEYLSEKAGRTYNKFLNEKMKPFYENYVDTQIERLNNPTSKNVRKIFASCLFLQEAQLNKIASIAKKTDNCIKLRHRLVHEGFGAHYTKIYKVGEYKNLFQDSAAKIDQYLGPTLGNMTKKRAPWNAITEKKLPWNNR